MSDSDNELQSHMDEFVSKHGHKPNASQLSKFAGCKYSEASRFLRSVKSSSKPSSSSTLPQQIKCIPTDSPTKPFVKTISSPKQTIEKPENTKPKSYSSTKTSIKKIKKKHCNKYELDMTGKEFGTCKCGFSKADHYNSSNWSDSDSNSNSNSDKEEQNIYNENIEQEPMEYEQKIKEENIYKNEDEDIKEIEKEKKEQIIYETVKENNENKIEKLQNMIQKLQGQLIEKQQEINKSYQEKENFKKILSEQRIQINKLKNENEILKQKQNNTFNNINGQKQKQEERHKESEIKVIKHKPKKIEMAQESVVSHSASEKKFLCYAIQKLGEENDNGFEIKFGKLFIDIFFEQIFEGLPGTLFGAKNKKIVTYASPMLMYPASKDVLIELKSKKMVNTNDVKQLLIKYIEKHMQKYRKDNLLFLLDAMDKSKESYAKACKCFEKFSISQQRN